METGGNIRRFIQRGRDAFLQLSGRERDFVRHGDVVLPAPRLRYCGKEFRDDRYFLASCEEEVGRLVNSLGLSKESSLLEIGCGTGRLPIGIRKYLGGIGSYHGVDIDRRAIRWCRKYISDGNPSFHFHVVDARHDRYRPRGRGMDETFSLPFEGKTFDIIYHHSVFAAMLEKDVRIYIKECRRVIKSTGKMFLTVFVEENVPDVTYNPEDYVMPCSGPLHITRFEKSFFLSIFEENGFHVRRFDHGLELGMQSGVYLEVADRECPSV